MCVPTSPQGQALRSAFGYGTHEEAVCALFQMACEQHDVPIAFSGLSKRVKVYEKKGVQGLFPKNFRNKNALKVQAGLPQDLCHYSPSHSSIHNPRSCLRNPGSPKAVPAVASPTLSTPSPFRSYQIAFNCFKIVMLIKLASSSLIPGASVLKLRLVKQ